MDISEPYSQIVSIKLKGNDRKIACKEIGKGVGRETLAF